MATKFLIQFITRGTSSQPQERIAAIGGRDPHGKVWRLTADEAAVGIASGEWNFFVLLGNAEGEVAVAVTDEGRKYLDSEMLMVLPPFPA